MSNEFKHAVPVFFCSGIFAFLYQITTDNTLKSVCLLLLVSGIGSAFAILFEGQNSR